MSSPSVDFHHRILDADLDRLDAWGFPESLASAHISAWAPPSPEPEALWIGGDGNDTHTGGPSHDKLEGEGGDDSLNGADGSDILLGGDGNDTLNGGSNVDRLEGGQGSDLFIVDNHGDTVVEKAGEGTDTIEAAVSYNMPANVEVLILSSGATLGVGNDLDNTMTAADDLHVSLDGGLGNDTLIAGAAIDTLNGNAGDDVYLVNNSSDVVVEAPGGGTDTVKSSMSFVLPDNVENLKLLVSEYDVTYGTGNGLDNLIVGNHYSNILDGEGGNDTLDGRGGHGDVASYTDAPAAVTVSLSIHGAQDTGGAGVDTLIGIEGVSGSAFDDLLEGSKGQNNLQGGDGADTLEGGRGIDAMSGGPGADLFIYRSILDAPIGARGGLEFISDLDDSDTIDLSRIDANVNLAGDQAFTVTHHHLSGVAGQLSITYDGQYTVVQGDVNGDKIADMEILILGQHTDFTGYVL